METSICTASLPEAVRAPLIEELREVFPDVKDTRMALLSQQPPAWVEIIASITVWKALLGAFVTAYGAQVGKEAGAGSVTLIKMGWHLGVKQASKGLREFYAGLVRAQNGIARRLGVQFKYYGAPNAPNFVTFSISVADEAEFFRKAALFGASIDGIATAFDHLRREGFDSSDPAWCIVRDDGFTLQWGLGRPDRHFDFAGLPMIAKSKPE